VLLGITVEDVTRRSLGVALPNALVASGDAISTVSDLARFDVALMDGVLLKPETFAPMRVQRIDTGDGVVAYGLGVTLPSR
jgi:CubicO group peptidase (beta-lactamase class C family)